MEPLASMPPLRMTGQRHAHTSLAIERLLVRNPSEGDTLTKPTTNKCCNVRLRLYLRAEIMSRLLTRMAHATNSFLPRIRPNKFSGFYLWRIALANHVAPPMRLKRKFHVELNYQVLYYNARF